MIAVLFELKPAESKADSYFKTAEYLKPLLEEIDGFVSIERYQSLSDPARFLSLSFWRDEQAIQAWRNKHEHRQAQRIGRNEIFDSYRLRVAEVIRDYSLTDRDLAPRDSRTVFDAR